MPLPTACLSLNSFHLRLANRSLGYKSPLTRAGLHLPPLMPVRFVGSVPCSSEDKKPALEPGTVNMKQKKVTSCL